MVPVKRYLLHRGQKFVFYEPEQNNCSVFFDTRAKATMCASLNEVFSGALCLVGQKCDKHAPAFVDGFAEDVSLDRYTVHTLSCCLKACD